MQELGVEIPKDAVLGRWALKETDEAASPEEASLEETESPDNDEGTVSEEYVAHLFTIFENYKSAAQKNAKP